MNSIPTNEKSAKRYRGHNSRIDARKLSISARNTLRHQAIHIIEVLGKAVEYTAELIGVCSKSVYNWIKKYHLFGTDALNEKGYTGNRHTKLDMKTEELLLFSITEATPLEYGYSTVLWTSKIVAELCYRWFKIIISRRTARRVMRKYRLSWQKPVHRSYRRNEDLIKYWTSTIFLEICRKAEREKAIIFFCDESSIYPDHNSGKTWGLRGVTPTVPNCGDRFKTNMISAISFSGQLTSMLFDSNMDSEAFKSFIRYLSTKTKLKIYLIIDNAPWHKSAATQEILEELDGWLELFYLPPYAPELNPVEVIWAYVKKQCIGASLVKSIEQLVELLEKTLSAISDDTNLCLSFFQKKELYFIEQAIIKAVNNNQESPRKAHKSNQFQG